MLLVIGDSHTVIWGGRIVLTDPEFARSLFPNISIRYLGAPLAYNLIADSDGTVVPGKWGTEVLTHVRENPAATAVCLCFGEIDLRTRGVKVAMETGVSLAESAIRIASRLIAFCDLLRKECALPIFVAAPVPSPHGIAWDSFFPSYGSERERNAVTRMFAQHLLEKSRQSGVFHVVSIVDQLLDPMLGTRTEYYADQIHLNGKGLDLLVTEFRRVARENNLELMDFWDPAGLLGHPIVREISKEIAVKVETKEQTNAFLIDLGYGTFPQRLRLNLKFDRPRMTFALSGGVSPKRLTLIGTYEADSPHIEIYFPQSYSCRFLHIALDASIKVSLDDIKLEVRSFLKP